MVTAGHCTYAVASKVSRPNRPVVRRHRHLVLGGGGPELLHPARHATFDRDYENDERYDTWSRLLRPQRTWSQAEATYTHPSTSNRRSCCANLGVVELSEPIYLDEYASLPEANYLDRVLLEEREAEGLSSRGIRPRGQWPDDVLRRGHRRKIDQKLTGFEGAYGYRDIAVNFSQGTCASATRAVRRSTSPARRSRTGTSSWP